jgi:hypothetical protein
MYGCIAALGLQQELCHTAGEQRCQAVDAARIVAVCCQHHIGLRTKKEHGIDAACALRQLHTKLGFHCQFIAVAFWHWLQG